MRSIVFVAFLFVAAVCGKTTLQTLEGKDLPLKDIIVKSEIVDFIGEVNIEQFYENDQEIPLECIYKFPIDEKAVITDLIAEIDGRVIKGISKPKETAKKEYQEAKAKGQTAFLMDENASDVVTLRVGNIPPKKSVKITVKYLTELGLEGDYLRFVLPTTIAPRYATSSPSMTNQDTNAPLISKAPYSIQIGMHLKMPSDISHISSPSHGVTVIDSEVENLPNERFLTLTVNNLNTDIILLIGIAKASESRVWLEEGTLYDTLMVSMYPHFESPFNNLPVPKSTAPQTVTVLFDKSGSMGGSSIIEAKRAVSLLVTKLKTQYPQVLFNIVTFSSGFSSMFSKPVSARDYADYALREIEKIDANGGTEMFEPLKHIISALNPEYSNNLIVLTDGEVAYTQTLLDWVQKNYQEHFRIFSIGIGHAASQELVNGVARVGKGTAEYAVPGDENLEQKVDRQLSRALAPTIYLDDVSWNVPTMEFSSPNRFPLPLYQKSRVLLFASIPHGSLQQTPQLKFQGKSIEIPISTVSGSVLAKLAAKYRIRDLERDGNSETKQEIINLATRYNLLSKETSYIAVDEGSRVDPQETQTVLIPLQNPETGHVREAIVPHVYAKSARSHYHAPQYGSAYVANEAVDSFADASAVPPQMEMAGAPQAPQDDYEAVSGNWFVRLISAGNAPSSSSFLLGFVCLLLWIFM